jgi:hypothetical protein
MSDTHRNSDTIGRRELLQSVATGAVASVALGPLIAAASTIAPGTSAKAVTTFTLLNFASAPSSGRTRFVLLFARGDLPAGTIPQLSDAKGVVSAQFDELSLPWSDGSAKLMVCNVLASDFGSDESRQFMVSAVPGSYGSSAAKHLSDLTSLHDFRVHFANVTQSNDATTAARGSGSFTASLRDFARTPTRVKQYHTGHVCTSWRVWGLAKDDATGQLDQDLKVTFYVSLHINPDGSIADTEHSAKISQDWWDAPNKHRLNYDAVYADGTNIIQSYPGIQHPYHSAWRTLRLDDDPNHAKPFWVRAIPTLVYQPNKKYWVKTGIIPPLDTDFTPMSCSEVGYRSNFVPLSPHDHGRAPGTGGSHPGRGLVPNMDAIRFMDPSPENARRARTNAEAGWGIPYHYKSRALRKRPIDAAPDIADTTIAMKMRPLPPPAYDFSAAGMPAPIDAYTGPCQHNIAQTFVPKTGGNGNWLPDQEASHAISYSFMTYLFEGDRATMECALELATNLNHQQAGVMHGACPIYYYSDAEGGNPLLSVYTKLLKIPPTQYSGLGSSRWVLNFRAIAWDMNIACHAALVCPANDEQCGSMQLFFRHRTTYHAANLPYMAPSQKAQGLWSMWITERYVASPWMMSFIAQAFPYAALAMEDANLTKVVLQCTQYYPISQWEGGTPYRAEDYRELIMFRPNSPYDPAENPFLPRDKVLKMADYRVGADGKTIDVSRSSVPMPFTDGDVLYFSVANEHGDNIPMPQGLTEATPYYATNSNGFTCQVATAPGGAPILITLPDPTKTYAVAYRPQIWSRHAVADPALFPIHCDDYAPMSHAALVATSRVPGNSVTPTLLQQAKAFLEPVNYSKYVAWRFD